MKSKRMYVPPDITEKIDEYVTSISNMINTVCIWRHVQSQTPRYAKM